MPRGAKAAARRKSRRARQGANTAPATLSAVEAPRPDAPTEPPGGWDDVSLAAHELARAEVGPDAGPDEYAAEYRARLAELFGGFAHGTRCSCGHDFRDHLGADGPCTHEDGRGRCRCGGYAELALAADGECADCGHMATMHGGDENVGACSVQGCGCSAFVTSQEKVDDGDELAVQPMLLPALRVGDDGSIENGDEVVAAITGWLGELDDDRARATAIRRALLAAAGDVAFGPEDGFQDLLDDVNETLNPGDLFCPPFRCVDAGVKLDKVLIVDADGDAYWVAPITIDAAGEPVLADQSEWIVVEPGWVEVDEADGDELEAGMVAHGTLEFTSFAEVALPAELEPGATLPPRTTTSPAVRPGPEPAGRRYAWTAVFCPEGVLTDDGRAFAPGSISWRDLPLSLMAQLVTEEGHDGAQVCGRIDRVWRDGNRIMAAGEFDEGEFGSEVARLVGDGTLRGVSVDIAIHAYEVGPQSDWFDEGGNWSPRDDAGDGGDAEDGPSLVDQLLSDEPMIFVVTDGVIGASTVCSFPAFADASIALQASLVAGARGGPALWTVTSQAGWTVVGRDGHAGVAVELPEGGTALAADGGPAAVEVAPARPPAEWFRDPELDELTPLTVTDDGRVYGHAWPWGACHIGFADQCVTAPHTQTGNAFFHLGEVELDDGSRVSVGKVTIDAPHANRRLSLADATAHYDNTGTVAAYVVSGEDEHGGWIAGSLRSDLPADTVRLLRGSTLSGDWRNVNGNLELVALLACNVPGFPVPRTRALVASGDDGGQEVLSLIMAGLPAGSLSAEERVRFAELAARARGGATFSELADRARAA